MTIVRQVYFNEQLAKLLKYGEYDTYRIEGNDGSNVPCR